MGQECNDIRWSLDDIKRTVVRIEERQRGRREQMMVNLLKQAVDSKVVQAALGDTWVTLVCDLLNTY